MSKKKEKVISLLKSSFLSRADIAKEVGVTPPYVSQIVRELGEKVLSEAFQKKMESYRLELIEMLREKISKFHLDDDKFYLQLKGMERLCKMMGFDAPDKVNVELQVPTKIEYIIDVDSQIQNS